jgi:outer membrane protein insertion porin family
MNLSVPSESVALRSLAGGSRYQGVVVRDIVFRGISEDAKVLDGFRELVAQESGQPLDRLKVRQSILALYATGRFATLQAQAERTAQNEILLVFSGKPNYFIGPVSVDGVPKRPTENQLVTTSKLQLGELFTKEKLDRAMVNIKSVLAENGFYQATLAHEEKYDSDTQLVTILFQVVPMSAARVGKITVEGDSGYTPEQVAKIARIHTGDVVSSGVVTRALQKLRKTYQKQKRLEAQAAVVSRKYHAEANTLDYGFRINRGPTVDIRVDGVKLRSGLLKKYIPVFEENAVDDDLLNEGRRNLRDYFQTHGYFDVRVTFTKEYDQAHDVLTVVYAVDRGVARKLVGVKIQGNKYFSSELIRERMSVRPAAGFLTHGVFSQSMLANDVQSIENLYKSNGFLEVKVASEVASDVAGIKDAMSVAIHIREGIQTRVGSLKIVGNQTVTQESLRDRIQLSENQPFSDSKLAEDRDVIVTYYYNNGFPEVQFESAVAAAKNDPHRMDVIYTIREGTQTFVDRVLLSGLHYTRPFVVRRQMKIGAGDPLSQIGILDSQRNLYDLGLFNEVDAAVQNPDGGSKYKDVLLDMREAKRWTFNYGVGVEIQTGGQSLNSSQINTAPAPGINVPPNTTPPQGSVNTANPQAGTGISPRVSFDVTRLNFRGRDHTILFKTNLSNLSRRALVSYDAPHWFDRENLRMTFTALAENTRDVRTFAAQRYEGSVQAEQDKSKVTTLLYRFQYRLVKVDPATLVISPELVPLYSKPVRVGMPSFTYIRDKRDDPIDTKKGNYTTFDTGVAAGVFGSAANFGRFMIQNSTYTPFKGRFVLARMTRIGVQEPFGTGDAAIVPLPERFYAGGAQSHRGFALNQAGPRDLFTGFPIGGNAVLLNQVELRLAPFPMPFVGENLNFVLFHDAGNVFTSGQDMVRSLFRWYQPRRDACTSESTRLLCGFNYMSQAFGLGARYKTPVGPVRFDFSYNPNPPSFPYFVQCPSTTPTGKNPGPCATLPPNWLIFQSGTLRHFNIFFSIGQTF